MAISLSSISKTTAMKAPRVFIYGGAGIGKTTWAAGAPNPVFVFTEDGAGQLEVDAFPKVSSFDEVMEAITTLYTEDHNFKTLVVDSVDHLEPLIWEKTCKVHQVNSIEEVGKGYGRGYVEALTYWRQFLDGVNALRDHKGMAVILIGHAQIKHFESPEHDAYDRYEPKMHKAASALVQESTDAILFAKQKTVTKSEDMGFNQKRSRGVSTGERVVCAIETAAYIAKNRYGLPGELPLAWGAFTAAIAASKAASNQPQAPQEAA